jgi:putative membrane protein
MTLEGLREFEAVRDFLYHRMRGVKDPGSNPAADLAAHTAANTASNGELASVLREIATELRAVRAALESRK